MVVKSGYSNKEIQGDREVQQNTVH